MTSPFDVVLDLYEPYETAWDTLAVEMRFLRGRAIHSEWLILDDLEDRRKEFYKYLKTYNLIAHYDAYISANAHVWDAVKEKARKRGSLDVKGDENTVYPYVAGLTWDIDLTALHSGAQDWRQAIRDFLEKKLPTVFKEIGLYPRYILVTGGGVQVRWKADDLYPISVLDRMEALNDVLNAFLLPDAKSDNIFDPPRIVRVPGSFNWKYGEPRKGAIAYKNLEEETNLEYLLQVLEGLGRDLGVVVEKKPKYRPPRSPPKFNGVRSIDVDFIFELLSPLYIVGHQNDLLIRLFGVFARNHVNIFHALDLLSRFVHHPDNDPGHVRNRLDHLTYPYGIAYNTIHKIPLTQIYGEGIYEELAEFYNSLVADLGIKYSAKDFERGLTYSRGEVAGWLSLRKKIHQILLASGCSEEEALTWLKIIMDGLAMEVLGGKR